MWSEVIFLKRRSWNYNWLVGTTPLCNYLLYIHLLLSFVYTSIIIYTYTQDIHIHKIYTLLDYPVEILAYIVVCF